MLDYRYSMNPWDAPTKTVFYSIARTDRSGAAIHDALMAHAYSYKGVHYGGACPGDVPPRNTTIDLVRALGLDGLFTARCPDKYDSNASIVPAKGYRERETALFTQAWHQALLKELSLNPQFAKLREHQPADIADDGIRPFTIAVHVRRGDVNPCRYPGRYLPNSHYMKLIEKYTPKSQNVRVQIFSQQTASFEPLTAYRDRGYKLFTDGDLPLAAVWRTLMTADVLIMSKSSFSHVPALLRQNTTVVYTKHGHHQPASWWDQIDHPLIEDTEAEIARLRREGCER